jgi:putative transposase
VEVLKESGYTVKDACEALGVSRSGYYASLRVKRVPCVSQGVVRDGDLLERIKAIKTGHPFWGYRRVRAWLVHREKIRVNEKRVRRVMRENSLMASQTVHKAKRTSQRSKPRAERPRQYWGIDMTKFMVSSLGWVYLIVVLDWFTKKIVGWDLSLRGRSKEWRQALEVALEREFPYGVRGSGLKLISDNGSQPTSVSFMRDMVTLGIEQIFTSYDNPKGNADTERMMRTIKEEIIWLNEFSSLEEAKEKIGHWIEVDYNKFYVHSELGYRSPEEFSARVGSASGGEEQYERQNSFKEAA